MTKEELIEMHGIVNEVLPDSRYRVTLENGHQLIAYTAGRPGGQTGILSTVLSERLALQAPVPDPSAPTTACSVGQSFLYRH